MKAVKKAASQECFSRGRGTVGAREAIPFGVSVFFHAGRRKQTHQKAGDPRVQNLAALDRETLRATPLKDPKLKFRE